MDCNCCHTNFNMTSKKLETSRLPQLQIKFNFIFKSYYLNIYESQDSTIQYFPPNCLSPTIDHTSACSVVVEDSSSLFEDVVEAIIDEIGDHLDEDNLLELVDHAWEELTKSFPTQTLPNYYTLYLHYEIQTEHIHVYDIPTEEPLEKYEVNSSNSKKGEGPCSICLEELDVGVLLKTPCSHVFHDVCIKKWLTTSRCCPFCRSQIFKE